MKQRMNNISTIMKSFLFSILSCFLFVTSSCQNTVQDDLDYIDPTTPSTTPLLFAKDFISKDSIYEYGSIFNKDVSEFYFGVSGKDKSYIMFSALENGKWTEPARIFPKADFSYNDPFLSNDENRLYYISDLQTSKSDTIKDYDIWYSERTDEGWSKPINAGENINSALDEYYISFTNDGSMYFSSKDKVKNAPRYAMDIYKSQFKNGAFQKPKKLPETINTHRYEADVFIAPDESYMIFCSIRKNGLGNGDLYISFKGDDGKWIKAKSMGPKINSKGHELCPFVTKDGKYFFYTSNEDIYWVSTEIFNEIIVN